MKTRVKILEARKSVGPGLERSWGEDIIKGSVILGSGIDFGCLGHLAHWAASSRVYLSMNGPQARDFYNHDHQRPINCLCL